MSCVEEAAGGIVGHAAAEPRRRPGVAVGPAQSLDASARDNKDRQRATIGWWLTGQAPRDECSGTKSRRSSTHSVERSVSADDGDDKDERVLTGKSGPCHQSEPNVAAPTISLKSPTAEPQRQTPTGQRLGGDESKAKS